MSDSQPAVGGPEGLVRGVRAPRRVFAAVVAATVAGHLVGVAYEVIVARRFGTGRDADALAFALTLVVAVSNEIVTWVATLFVPAYVEATVLDGHSAARRFFRSSLAALLLGAGTLASAFALGAPGLATILAPALATDDLAAGLIRLFAPLMLLVPLAGLLAGVVQAHGRFVIAALRQLCWYGGALALLIAFGAGFGANAVPLGMTLGLVVFCALLVARIPFASASPATDARSRLPRVAASLFPLVVASASNYANVAFERSIAARLPIGSLAALTYAYRLTNVPIALFVVNATTMMLPPLAARAASGDTRAVETAVARAVRLALVFTALIAGLAIALGEPAVRLLLERGEFTADSTRLTSVAVAWYAPALLGIAAVQVLARSYQALQRIGRLVGTGLAGVALSVTLMPTLTALLGFRGLPLAMSISALALFVIMLAGLRDVLPGLGVAAIVGSACRATIAAALATAAAWMVREVGAGPIWDLVVGVAAGVIVYATVLRVIAADDARLALDALRPGRRALERR